MLSNVAPDLDAWEAWRPQEVAQRLKGIGAPWWVVGGWALDLWHGRETRPHNDLEIATTRAHFPAFRRHLSEFDFYAAANGEVKHLATGEAPPEEVHQNWVLDEGSRRWRLDIFLEPGDDETWVCRRDGSIRLPRREIVAHSGDGIPYLLPQAVLLFKAKATRSKDTIDFELAMPSLDPPAREWLRDSLEKLHPGHPWIDSIRSQAKSGAAMQERMGPG